MAPQPTSAALSPTDRTLRLINLFAFIPGLAFLIATALTRGHWWHEHQVWAFVGLAPLSFSAVLGLAVLLFKPRSYYATIAVVVFDLIQAAFTLSICIWGWVVGRTNGMLGGHAASVLVVNFCIHAFFVLRHIWTHLNATSKLASPMRLFRRVDNCSRCPHCLREAQAKKTSVKAVGVSGGKETYHRVPGRDDGYDEELDGEASVEYSDARPSTDDETARLV